MQAGVPSRLRIFANPCSDVGYALLVPRLVVPERLMLLQEIMPEAYHQPGHPVHWTGCLRGVFRPGAHANRSRQALSALRA